MTTVAVLVPASGDLSSKGLGPADLFHSAPAMLPVGNRLAIDIIRGHYLEAEPAPRLYLAAAPSSVAPIPLRPLQDYSLIDVGETKNICDTIAKALEQISEDLVVINPVTTIPPERLTEEASILLGRDAMYQERWSSVSFDEARRPTFHFRDLGPGPGRAFPFTGLLSCRRDELVPALAELAGDEGGDLLHLAERLHARGACGFAFGDWIDAGHRATYARSKRFCMSSRAFNRVTYSEERNLILKESTERATLEGEGRYLAALPEPLKRYFPALQSSEPDADGGWRLAQEYVPFPTLAETYLYWDVGPNAWEGIFARLDSILREFARCSEPRSGDCAWLYSEKCERRLGELERRLATGDLQPHAALVSGDLVINGGTYPSLSRTMREAVGELKPLEHGVPLQRIHGDLCLNNILCEPLFGVMKLIDPRGSEDGAGLAPGIGDPRYDLAKLNHSFHGLYDAVVNNLFRIERSGNALDLSVYRPPNYELVLDLFRERILSPSLDQDTASLLTASLFLSMLPLHAEDPERMLALTAIGTVLLHDRSMRRIIG